MIIDVHTHFRAKGIFEELIKRGLTRIVVDGEGKRHVYDGDYYRHTMPEQYVEPDIEKRVAYLDQHGIDIQVLSTPHSSSYPSEHAPEIARMTNEGLAQVRVLDTAGPEQCPMGGPLKALLDGITTTHE